MFVFVCLLFLHVGRAGGRAAGASAPAAASSQHILCCFINTAASCVVVKGAVTLVAGRPGPAWGVGTRSRGRNALHHMPGWWLNFVLVCCCVVAALCLLPFSLCTCTVYITVNALAVASVDRVFSVYVLGLLAALPVPRVQCETVFTRVCTGWHAGHTKMPLFLSVWCVLFALAS